MEFLMKKILSIVALLSIVSVNAVGRDGGHGAPRASAAVVQANLLRLKNGQSLTSQQKSELISNVQKLDREKAAKRRLVAKSIQRGQKPSKELTQAALSEGRHGIPKFPGANTKPVVYNK